MKPDMRKGHVLLAKLVAAGEVPVGLTMYNSNIESLKRKGEPIDFVPVQPVAARPQGIGVAKEAPHPPAASSSPTSCSRPRARSSTRAWAACRRARR